MKRLFINAKINNEICDILVENGKIAQISKNIERNGKEIIDVSGLETFPGLIDIHTHGCVGKDTMDGDVLNEISVYMAKNGVTSFLPTTMTVSLDDIKNVVNKPITETDGATVLGFHLEGPYINKSRKGAQNEEFVRIPDIDEFNSLQNIVMVTIAPEVNGGMEFIKKCDKVVSIGHTDADYDCSMEAIKNGAKCLTHTFNVMPPLSHRAPGPVGAAADGDAFVQVICDGVHIHKSVLRLLYKVFGKERMIVISDSMRATGLPDGEYDLGGQNITVKNAVARTFDGALAGSTSNMLSGVKNLIEFGIPKEDAFFMASATPAMLLGLNKGRIEAGFDADFIILDDELNVKMTVVNGKIV